MECYSVACFKLPSSSRSIGLGIWDETESEALALEKKGGRLPVECSRGGLEKFAKD